MKNKQSRRLKVYGQSNGYNYKEVPTIILKGQWLEKYGFSAETPITVACEDGQLLIKILESQTS